MPSFKGIITDIIFIIVVLFVIEKIILYTSRSIYEGYTKRCTNYQEMLDNISTMLEKSHEREAKVLERELRANETIKKLETEISGDKKP